MNEIEKREPMELSVAVVEQLMINGNLAGLTQPQRIEYYAFVCDKAGLDAATRPFDYITMNGKLVMYANKNCAQQLRRIHGVSVVDSHKDISDDLCTFTVTVKNANGRTDTGTGVIWVKGMTGEKLANAIMKAETKAKRRATLSICELGMLDETEIPTKHKPVACTVSSTSKAKLLLESKTPEGQAKKAFQSVVLQKLKMESLPPETLRGLLTQAQTLAGTQDIQRVAEWLRTQGEVFPETDSNETVYYTIAPKLTGE